MNGLRMVVQHSLLLTSHKLVAGKTSLLTAEDYMIIQVFGHDPLITISNEETFFQDFLGILKHLLQNF